MRRLLRMPAGLVVASSVVLLVALAPARSRAQISLEQFEPAPLADDGFAVSRPVVLPRRAWSVSLWGDYANDPLVYRLERGARSQQSVVAHHLVLHVAAAFAVHHKLTLFTQLPVHSLMDGDDALLVADTEAEGAGVGDLALGARLALWGDLQSAFALSVELIARLPTARLFRSEQRYSGDQVGSYEPGLVAEVRKGRFSARTRAAVRMRKPIDMQNLELGHQLVLGAGIRLEATRDLSFHAELLASTHLARAFDQGHTPSELLFGAKYQAARVWLGVAGGPGLVDGYGSPDARAVAAIGLGPRAQERVAAPRVPAEAPPADLDHDGIVEPADECPTEAEDRDGHADDDGCPEQEAALDSDADGLPDRDDRCPARAEDPNGSDDQDGCPDADGDGDGVLDLDDRCPSEHGTSAQQGCPQQESKTEEPLVEFGRVEFAIGRDAVAATSFPTLRAVHSILNVNPTIERVRVEGHADDSGDASFNQQLSKRRARSVARWLVSQGVAEDRLDLAACGQRSPLEVDRDKRGRQRNRRVEFHVLAPPPATSTAHADCESITLE